MCVTTEDRERWRFGGRVLKAVTHEKKKKMCYHEMNLPITVSKNLKRKRRGVDFRFLIPCKTVIVGRRVIGLARNSR